MVINDRIDEFNTKEKKLKTTPKIGLNYTLGAYEIIRNILPYHITVEQLSRI